MEQTNSTYQLAEVITKPVLFIKDQVVDYANRAARNAGIPAGTEISKLIPNHLEDYKQLKCGYLLVTVTLGKSICDATISKGEEYDFLTIEFPVTNTHLSALSLAGMQLRTPLAGLSATLDLLFTKKVSRAFQPYADPLRKGIHTLHRAINNMSDAIHAETPAPAEEVFDVGSLIDEAIAKSSAFLRTSSNKIQYKRSKGSIYTLGNRTVLNRALFNMLSNAIKFSEPDTPIDVQLNQTDTKLQLSVTNHCHNVRPADLACAFTSYQRPAAIEDTRSGIGLGMLMIKAAAKTHHGTVLIDQPSPELVRVTLTIEIRQPTESTQLRSPRRKVDYTGGRDQALLELSDVLPAASYHYDTK